MATWAAVATRLEQLLQEPDVAVATKRDPGSGAVLADNDRRLLQLIADQADYADFELRVIARSLLAVDAELREISARGAASPAPPAPQPA